MARSSFFDAWSCRSALERETASARAIRRCFRAASLIIHLSRLDLGAARAARASSSPCLLARAARRSRSDVRRSRAARRLRTSAAAFRTLRCSLRRAAASARPDRVAANGTPRFRRPRMTEHYRHRSTGGTSREGSRHTPLGYFVSLGHPRHPAPKARSTAPPSASAAVRGTRCRRARSGRPMALSVAASASGEDGG